MENGSFPDRFLANVTTLVTGTSIAQAIPVLLAPVLARLYDPSEIGLFALYFAVASLAAALSTGRYELALMLPEADREARGLMLLSVAFCVAAAGVSAAAVLAMETWDLSWPGPAGLDVWFPYLPLGIFGLGLYQVLQGWANRQKRYRRMAVANILQAGGTAIFQVLLRVAGAGPRGLLFGQLLGLAAAAGYLLWLEMASGEREAAVSVREILKLGRRYRKFPLFASWSGLLNTASIQVPLILMSSFFAGAVVGSFSLALRVVKMPMTLLGVSVSQVFLNQASADKGEPEKLGALSFQVFQKMLLLGAVPLSVVCFYGDVLFGFCFGSNWHTAGVYAQYLAVWVLSAFVVSPLTHLYSVLERQLAGLVFNLLMFGSRVGCIVVGGVLLKDDLATMAIFSLTGAIVWVLACLHVLSLVGVPMARTLRWLSGVGGGVFLVQYLLSAGIRSWILGV